jgi:nucleoside-diphosphate-sugar epimerase
VGEGAIHAFVTRCLANEPIRIHNEGDQIRSWCYIDDIVEGVLLCLVRDEAVGHAFNIGNPRSTITIFQLARLVKRLADSKSEITFVEWDFPDVELRIPDVKKAERLLGYRAKVDLEDGISRTLDWYRDA